MQLGIQVSFSRLAERFRLHDPEIENNSVNILKSYISYKTLFVSFMTDHLYHKNKFCYKTLRSSNRFVK